ncbi:MAG: SpoIIE family protein phosphatase [Candidatus Syntrophosphaera sp.]
MRQEKKTRTLATQINTFIFIFLAIIFVIAAAVMFYTGSKLLIDITEDSIGNLVGEKVQQIDGKLARIAIQGKSFKNIVMYDVLTEDELRYQILHLLYDNPDLVSICIAYADTSQNNTLCYRLKGSKFVTTDITRTDYKLQNWYQIPYLTQKNYWSDPWYDEWGTRQLVCSYSMNLVMKGTLVGIIRMDVPFDKLQRIIQQMRVRKTGYAFMISGNGTFIAHPSDSLGMNYSIFDLAEMRNSKELRQIGQNMLDSQTDFVKLRSAHNHGAVWIYYKPLPSNNWILAVQVPQTEFLSDLYKLMLIYLIISILSFVMIAIIIYMRTRSINEPLEEIVSSFKSVGQGDLDIKLQANSNTYEIKALADAYHQMRESLKTYIENLKKVTDERNRILDEVHFASMIQRNLIPQNDNPTLKPDNIELHGILQPAGQIGGDLYDFFLIDQDHFCFAIADVVGKGIGAAMSMTMVTTLLRTTAILHKGTDHILREINRFLVKNNLESNFVTMILGIVDLRSGRMMVSNAGHVPLYVLSAERELSKFANTHATALGFFEDLTVDSEIIQLDPGDEVVLVTDGITEAISPDESLFGTAGLELILGHLAEISPETTARAILEGVEEFSGAQDIRDDITILVFKFLDTLAH